MFDALRFNILRTWFNILVVLSSSSSSSGFKWFECGTTEAKIAFLSPRRPRCSAVWCPNTLLLFLLQNLPVNAYHYPEPESVMLHSKVNQHTLGVHKSNSTCLLGMDRGRGGQTIR